MSVQDPGVDAGHPRVIGDTPLARVWHKTDTTFRRPKAVLYISVMNPRSYSSPEAAVLARLACMLLTEHLNSVTYEASLAGLSFSLSTTSHGFQLVVKGCALPLSHTLSADLPSLLLSHSLPANLPSLSLSHSLPADLPSPSLSYTLSTDLPSLSLSQSFSTDFPFAHSLPAGCQRERSRSLPEVYGTPVRVNFFYTGDQSLSSVQRLFVHLKWKLAGG